MADTLLDIINDDDEVIGQALRSEIHAKGLLHREANIWFITPQKEMIWQKRSLTKDTYPGLLTVTVGGHVEAGENYQTAVIREALEETGLQINISQLTLLGFRKFKNYDQITGNCNYSNRAFYGYIYKDALEKLASEEGEGFEKIPVQHIFSMTEEEKRRFTPSLLDEDKYAEIYQDLAELVERKM